MKIWKVMFHGEEYLVVAKSMIRAYYKLQKQYRI